MRSPRELLFRLRQEAANLARLAVPPPAEPAAAAMPNLPPPAAVADALRGSAHARKIVRIARLVLRHRFPLLGHTIETGPEIDWSRDYVHGKTSPRRYFRRIPYLDFAAVGDHKLVWELNRHQHWVVLAQAWLFTGEEEFLDEIRREFRSWVDANPYLRSINWASALEVALRALSWMWMHHLTGGRVALLSALYRHGEYLAGNLSVYFSPNTHLLGEAVALHALGLLFGRERWKQTGAAIVCEQLERQVRADGSHFEQSLYYHVYALDMFLFHLCAGGDLPREKLRRMTDFLRDISGPARRLPLIGDDDGGRLFHSYGARDRFGRATLATAGALLGGGFGCEDTEVQAAWWTGARPAGGVSTPQSGLYADAGLAILVDGPLHAIFDAGPFGPGSAGHSHSDTLSLVVRHGGEDILIDPGTYTYIADPEWRERFRGSAAHNTVRVDGLDQAAPAGPFRWQSPPEVRLCACEPGRVEAVCRYHGIEHRREVRLNSGRLVIEDTVSAPPGEHLVEQFWHAGAPVSPSSERSFRIGTCAELSLSGPGEVELIRGWRSGVLGHKTPAPVIRACTKTAGVVRLAAVLDYSS